jgi:hypothetical protein
VPFRQPGSSGSRPGHGNRHRWHRPPWRGR